MTLEKNFNSELPKGDLGDFVDGMLEVALTSLSCNPNPEITPSYSYMHKQGKEYGDFVPIGIAIIASLTML